MPEPSVMRVHRVRMKLTCEEAAEKLDASPSTYQRWDRGEQRPHLRTQRRIAEFYGVTPHAVEERFYDQDDCPTCSATQLGRLTHGHRSRR